MAKKLTVALWIGALLLVMSTSAVAMRCVDTVSRSLLISDQIPGNITVPADATDGEVIWESPVHAISITCDHDWGRINEGVYMYVNPAHDAIIAAGTAIGIRVNGQVFTQSSGRIYSGHDLLETEDSVTFPFLFSVLVLKQGASPASGMTPFNDFRVFQLDGIQGINSRPDSNLNYLINGNVRFIGCFANLDFSPSDTVDFGTIRTQGTAGEVAVQKSVTLAASRSCTTPYGLDISFTPMSGTLIDATTWDIGQGVSISLIDQQTSTAVPLDGSHQPFVDLSNVTSGSRPYVAQLKRLTSSATPGAFTASLMINLNYK
jgi:type 1 fimbria pilin